MIGVFDSGFGGLTILKEFIKSRPEYDYVYLGDNARAPYGDKSQKLIYEYTAEAVDFLFKQGCELVIIACNTSSAEALRKIQQEWLPANAPGKKVLGVTIPIAEEAAKFSLNGKIGVIGTKATVISGSFGRELNKINPALRVYSQPCPLLVPLIEENWISKPETKMILRKYLRPLKEKRVGALILGCTHYGYLLKEIRRMMGKNCRVFNPSKAVAASLAEYLKRHSEIDEKLSKSGKRIFYSSSGADDFKRFGVKILKEKMEEVYEAKLIGDSPNKL